MKLNKLSLFYCLAILFAISFSACGDDDGGSGNVDCNDASAVTNAISDELQAVNDASTAFSNDPTNNDLCEDFKDAYIDYIDALRDLRDCANQAGVTDWQDTLDAAEAAAEDLLCM